LGAPRAGTGCCSGCPGRGSRRRWRRSAPTASPAERGDARGMQLWASSVSGHSWTLTSGIPCRPTQWENNEVTARRRGGGTAGYIGGGWQRGFAATLSNQCSRTEAPKATSGTGFAKPRRRRIRLIRLNPRPVPPSPLPGRWSGVARVPSHAGGEHAPEHLVGGAFCNDPRRLDGVRRPADVREPGEAGPEGGQNLPPPFVGPRRSRGVS